MTSLEKERAKALKSITPGLDEFSNKFYEHFCHEKDGNVVTSPLGISILLAMAANGARGPSARELSTSTCLKINFMQNLGYRTLIHGLNSLTSEAARYSDEAEVWMANAIIASNSLEIRKMFEEDMEYFFLSPVIRVDFSDRNEVCKIVNSWYREKTKTQLTKVLKPDVMPVAPSLLLFSTIHFQCAWCKKFQEWRTEMNAFHVTADSTIEVPTIHGYNCYTCEEIPEMNAKFVEIPLKASFNGESMSLMIFMPNEVGIEKVKELEKNLSTVNFCKLLHSDFDYSEVIFALPIFRIESLVDVSDVLKKMGLKSVFDKDKADFNLISKAHPLFVDGIVQRIVLDISERGVNAAGFRPHVDRKSMGGYRPAKQVEFIVDRPFVCIIVVTELSIPIFMARVVEPML